MLKILRLAQNNFGQVYSMTHNNIRWMLVHQHTQNYKIISLKKYCSKNEPEGWKEFF